MKKQDYTANIMVKATANQVFNSINDVRGWWSENIEGSTENLNDVFTIHFGESFVTMKIIESIPDKKIVWNVTDCYLLWLSDKKEWKDTQNVFEISSEGDSTKMEFTHIGLTPQVECYEGCVKGWDQYIKDSLVKLIVDGQGLPQRKVMAAATANK